MILDQQIEQSAAGKQNIFRINPELFNAFYWQQLKDRAPYYLAIPLVLVIAGFLFGGRDAGIFALALMGVIIVFMVLFYVLLYARSKRNSDEIAIVLFDDKIVLSNQFSFIKTFVEEDAFFKIDQWNEQEVKASIVLFKDIKALNAKKRTLTVVSESNGKNFRMHIPAQLENFTDIEGMIRLKTNLK